jgi:hypothetical protein
MNLSSMARQIDRNFSNTLGKSSFKEDIGSFVRQIDNYEFRLSDRRQNTIGNSVIRLNFIHAICGNSTLAR